MDKQSFGSYGTLVAVVLIVAMMISFATPFGAHITEGVKNLVLGFDAAGQAGLDGMETDQSGNPGGGNGGGAGGVPEGGLAAPMNLMISNSMLTFDPVANATEYVLTVNGGAPVTYAGNSINIGGYLASLSLPINFKVTASDSTGTYAASEDAEYVLDWEGTWVFNETLDFSMLPEGCYDLSFTLADETAFKSIKCSAMDDDGNYSLTYRSISSSEQAGPSTIQTGVYRTIELWGQPAGWASIDYTTITITSAPTNEALMAWLRANITRNDNAGHTHSFDTIIERVDSTCAVNGYEIYTCECGETYRIELVLDLTTHVYEDDICVACGDHPSIPHVIENEVCVYCGAVQLVAPGTTWILNNEIEISWGVKMFAFSCNGKDYDHIYFSQSSSVLYFGLYGTSPDTAVMDGTTQSWQDETYKTIVITEVITDQYIFEWLQANATRQ